MLTADPPVRPLLHPCPAAAVCSPHEDLRRRSRLPPSWRLPHGAIESAPTLAPAAKKLVNFVGSGKANMQTCEGDCDSDSDCAGSLKCFQCSSKREAAPRAF
jgi:hypothetical protein